MRHVMSIAALLALAISIAPAMGAKPGSGATLSITPNEAAAWSHVSGSGCGYDGETSVYVDIRKPEALAFIGAVVDSNGCISFTFTTDGPGTYSVSTRQQLSNGKKWTVMATYELPVVG